MRLTIIPVDLSVGVDGVFYSPLDLSVCNIPSDVHALQWHEDYGCIEIKQNQNISNQNINTLPEWATACVDVWQTKDTAVKASMPTEQEQLTALSKSMRNTLLYNSDWTQLPNAPLTDAKKQEWADYRQLLRDVTKQPNYPFEISWPIAPTGN